MMQPKKDPWGGKGGIILKLQNDNNISDGNNSLMIRGIMKEVLLAKADGVNFGPDLKGQIKTGRECIIYMDSQEAQIIDDVMDSGMSTLTAWSLANNHREVEELSSVCIYAVGTCLAKLNF